MPLSFERLGNVLCRIYDFDFGGTIYLPDLPWYESDTPCIVATPPTPYARAELDSLHQSCLARGFTKWLNVAVVSDTCDDVAEQTEPCLIADFNEGCQEGGWLRKNMNYWS